MIEQVGTVVAVSGRLARVAAERQSACGSCGLQGACGTSLLARLFGRRPSEIAALNPVGAVVGDRVVVGVAEDVMLRMAAAAYLVPVVALIAGALLGETVGGAWAGAASLSGAVAGLALALLWLRGYSVGAERQLAGGPRILRKTAAAVTAPPSATPSPSP